MKLSDAILLGSTLSKQGFGTQAIAGDERCALGAARQALGMVATESLDCFKEIREAYPFSIAIWKACPNESCSFHDNVRNIIWHLNDTHRWTREQIAGWVATIEPKEEVLPVGEYCDVHQEAVSG